VDLLSCCIRLTGILRSILLIFFSCPCVWCRLCYVLCSLSTKNLPTMQFMPLIITSQCKLSVKIANALSCVCQEFLSLAEQLLCQVLVGAYLFPGNTPCIRSSYASFWFWFGKVRSRANILTFCGLNVSTTACRAFTNRHHLHFSIVSSTVPYSNTIWVPTHVYLRENMFWVLNVKTKLCYSVGD